MNSLGVEDSQLLFEAAAETMVIPEALHRTSARNRFEKVFTGIEVLADWITVIMAVILGYETYHFLHLGHRIHYPLGSITYISFAVATLFILLLDRDGAYRAGSSLLRIKETERSLRVSAQMFLLVLPVTFFGNYLFSRWVFLIAMLFVPLLQTFQRQLMFLAARTLRARGVGVQKVVIYGAGNSGRRVFSALIRSPKLGLNPVVLVDDSLDVQGQRVFEYAYRRGRSVEVIPGPITSDLLNCLDCEFLIIAIPTLSPDKFSQALRAASASKVRLAFLPGHADVPEDWTEHADIDGILLSVVGRTAKEWHYDLAKRPFDFLSAIILIGLLTPVWFLIALLVRLDSQGPILFRQQRVGKGARLFWLYKFRSMYVNAPKYSFSPTNPTDPRITRIGRFLRRTSLDELPQLINVLKGEMSLVGPRPEMPFIVSHYNPVARQRLEVTPGITGLWQLSADRAFSIHENIQYDLYYLRHRSFFMDFAILLHTLVFAMHGI
jgi:exopolysaccharide biosynthesis polyprenyl glycosylphosphotransferase